MLYNNQDKFTRGHLFLRSPSSTIYPDQTVFPVPGLSIVPVDNDSNQKNTSANPTTNTITANRSTSSTHSQSKPYQNNNTNEQLAKVLG